ncbi:hypothetical protein D3C87_2165860 [compost metagenome]
MKIKSGRQLEQVPSKAGIVEIDQPYPAVRLQEILRYEIGMNHPVNCRGTT